MIDEKLKVEMITAIAKADITLSLLFLKFGDAVVSLDKCLEYTSYSTISEANRAASEGRLDLPTFRLSESQKAPRFVSIRDLAEYIDEKRKDASRFSTLMSGKKKRKTISEPAQRRKKDTTLLA